MGLGRNSRLASRRVQSYAVPDSPSPRDSDVDAVLSRQRGAGGGAAAAPSAGADLAAVMVAGSDDGVGGDGGGGGEIGAPEADVVRFFLLIVIVSVFVGNLLC
jgi:hypothetical protein